MRKGAVWILSVGGVVGLLVALSFEWRKGPDGSAFRIGYPDSWVVWESTPNGGFRWEIDFIRWSVLILIASVYSVYYAVRLSRRPPADVEPATSADPARSP
jgi:hypothetical protein